MKIATWNVERLAHRRSLNEILSACEQVQADILILTETDAQVHPQGYKYCLETPLLSEIAPSYYKPTENRVSIFTNYKCVQFHPTYDRYTALCAELETENGPLLVYGTIIGIYGNRNAEFLQSLRKQVADWEQLTSNGKALCIGGDYNCSFADNYYFTYQSREAILHSFSQNKIALLTKDRAECIDHIAVSQSFFSGTSIQINEWNDKKTLSDHKGIAVNFY